MREEKSLLKQTLELHGSLMNLVHSAILGIYDKKFGTTSLTLENSEGPDVEVTITSKELGSDKE